jgi:hypothetical protein
MGETQTLHTYMYSTIMYNTFMYSTIMYNTNMNSTVVHSTMCSKNTDQNIDTRHKYTVGLHHLQLDIRLDTIRRLYNICTSELEFLTILWRLKCRIFKQVRVYNRAQTGYRFCVLIAKITLCKQLRKNKIRPNDSTSVYYSENILILLLKPCALIFSPTIISECLSIRA